MKTNKRGKRTRRDTEVPVNPLPASNLGDMNQMEPTELTEQATWQPYKSSTAHAESPGHLDEQGLRDQDDLTAPRKRHGHKYDTTDKDE